MKSIGNRAVNIRSSLAIVLLVSVLTSHAQFDWTTQWTGISIECPCTLQSEDNQTAQLQFSLKNNLDVLVDELLVTVAIAGEFTDREESYKTSAFLDTVAITETLQPDGLLEISTTVDLGVIPNGHFFFELVLHDDEEIKQATTVDSIWFSGEITIPTTGLNLAYADYLVDADEDGIDDLNEKLENSDPNDPEELPPPPIIDVLVLYTTLSMRDFNLEPSTLVQHNLSVTEYLFEKSGSPVLFRTVGLLTHADESDLADGDSTFPLRALPTTAKLALREEYQPDFTLVFRGHRDDLCGIAEEIGGLRGRGFIHPQEHAEYTEVFLSILTCPVTVTAHEIGHLMGLGHSFVQGSVGTFHWSRGHGVEGDFGTIMAYARSAYSADEVDVFSNPDIDCQGTPCGISHHLSNEEQAANATLSLNITKYQLAKNNAPDPEFDIDEDGRGADVDAFPLDSTEWDDTDGDRYGDNRDAFPNDPLEWADTDGDGIGDNSDPDIDNDGRLNMVDAAPFDAEIQTIPLLKIVSDNDGDQFGRTITRINDFDSDGLADLAVLAPKNQNPNGMAGGTVYLFSFADFTAIPDNEAEPSTSIQLSSLLDAGETWQIHADTKIELGQQLKLIQRNATSASSPELLIGGPSGIYLISLTANDLNALDGADGEMDRQILLEHCSIDLKCLYLWNDPSFLFYDISDTGDIDDDGLTDLAVLGVHPVANQTLMYVLTRRGIESAYSGESESMVTFVDAWEADDSSLLIHAQGVRRNLSVANLGSVIGGSKPELGIGLAGTWGTQGRFYLLSTDQFSQTATLDSDGDRRIAMDDFVRVLSTYRVTAERTSGFAGGVDVLNDLNGDGQNDVFLWDVWIGGSILTTVTIRVLDLQDGQLDASVTIKEDVQETEGVWTFSNIRAAVRPERAILKSNDSDTSDGLVAKYRHDFMYTSFQDLDYLDDPSAEDLNGTINLPSRNQFDNVYRIRLPFGPKGLPVYGGITSLGDIDGDQLLDFTITVHSSEIDRNVSEVYVVYSSALELLDQADEAQDHFVALHNDFTDTDGDGVPNIFDLDDDGDGLNDRNDFYPLASGFQHDIDSDGYANKLDAFPLDNLEQFDLDSDGRGDRLDPDVDGDGLEGLERDDPFPYDTDNDGLNNDVDMDDDGDGIPDIDDMHPLDTDNDGKKNQEDLDDDNDGIEDASDEFPLDTDNDGQNNELDADDDGDGVPDAEDAFPLDATEMQDTDGDGFGDNSDHFVEDATEWADHDMDGLGDNADLDDDNDGVADVDDAFPLDSEEWLDSDGDNYGDNIDQFPRNHLEWVDEDGDGLGDNYGIEGFASYRIESPWFRDPNGILESHTAVTQIIEDVNHDGFDELVVTNGFLDGFSHPIFYASSGELEALDLLDGHVDRQLNLVRIQEEPNSWQFSHIRRGFIGPKRVVGTATQLVSESLLDLVISGPYDYRGTGGVYVVPGDKFASADGLDGAQDGVIDYYRCIRNQDCLAIGSLEDDHGLGTSVELLTNFFGSSETSMVLSATIGQTRRNERDGIPMAYVLSDSAIKAEWAATSDFVLDVAEVADRTNAISIYPEQDVIFAIDGRTELMRLPDLDQDQRDDFVISLPNRDFAYLIMSGDINAADSADGESDRKVDLESIYEQSGSYRFSGFDFQKSQLTGQARFGETMPRSQPRYLAFTSGTTSYLVNAGSLQGLDGSDGETDGKISEINADRDENVWSFPDMRSVFVCHANDSTTSSRVVATNVEIPRTNRVHRSFRMYSVELDKLAELDAADGNPNGSVRLDSALADGIENQWRIEFGELAHGLAGLHVGCAGDLDKDGLQDYTITIKQWISNETGYRTSVTLLMGADLALIDELDDNLDQRLNVSILWPGAFAELQ